MPKGSPELTNARREEIIDACEELYKTMSFKEITIKEIGNVTSFTRTSIYNYFQTKEEIFLSLLKREYELWISYLKKEMERHEQMSKDFSATGTTEKLAEYAADATGADLYEIQPEKPYTAEDLDYGDSDSRSSVEMDDPDARPAISGSVENMEQYDIVIIGYPNWWASIPMPIASFLEEYDFSGKTIVPFCSHGGGRFGQSLTAIAKLAPNAELGEGLSVHYSGGSSLPDDIAEWLEINGLKD